jgi:hypothetical protein
VTNVKNNERFARAGKANVTENGLEADFPLAKFVARIFCF